MTCVAITYRTSQSDALIVTTTIYSRWELSPVVVS